MDQDYSFRLAGFNLKRRIHRIPCTLSRRWCAHLRQISIDMMTNDPSDHWEEKPVPLKDVVISNSWALQAILQYLEEIQPGARDRIWEHYLYLKDLADQAKGAAPHEETDDIGTDDCPEEDESSLP